MKFPQKWMDHWFLRGIAGLLGFRNPYNADVYAPFTPYFQYRIGPYQTDHHLYFIAEPRKWEYISEIFQKMYEYRGYDLIRYIDFHYQAYGDKADFLRFLRHEASREQRELRKYRYCFWVRLPRFKERLRATLAWVEEEEGRLRELPVESAALGQQYLVRSGQQKYIPHDQYAPAITVPPAPAPNREKKERKKKAKDSTGLQRIYF